MSLPRVRLVFAAVVVMAAGVNVGCSQCGSEAGVQFAAIDADAGLRFDQDATGRGGGGAVDGSGGSLGGPRPDDVEGVDSIGPTDASQIGDGGPAAPPLNESVVCDGVDEDADGVTDEDCTFMLEPGLFGAGWASGGDAAGLRLHQSLSTPVFEGTSEGGGFALQPAAP